MKDRRWEYSAAIVTRAAEFLREVAVLVFVFSLLDQFLRGGISLGWVLETVLISFYFFGAGIVVEVEGRRRFHRAHDH
jgi:hypothetical protein